MAISNPGFETASAHPGLAADWTLVTHTSLSQVAGFGPAPFRGWEGFEWCEWQGDFDKLVRAFFGSSGFEGFESKWHNDAYLTEVSLGSFSLATFSHGAVEDMQSGWQTADYATGWSALASLAGQFNGQCAEGFASHWRDNHNYSTDWAQLYSGGAVFNGGSDTAEHFESDWPSAKTL